MIADFRRVVILEEMGWGIVAEAFDFGLFLVKEARFFVFWGWGFYPRDKDTFFALFKEKANKAIH